MTPSLSPPRPAAAFPLSQFAALPFTTRKKKKKKKKREKNRERERERERERKGKR